MAPALALALGALLLAAPALARTDLTGCTYYDSVVVASHDAPYATRVWYVPDTGEVCGFLDCGGGRAPPKTTVPGCPQYSGTATYSPSFIDPKTLGRAAGASGSSAPATATSGTATAGTATLTTGVRTTAAPSVTGTASGAGSSSGSGSASSAAASSAAATESAKSAEASQSGAAPSSSTGGGKTATTTGATTAPTGAAAGLPAAGAVAVLGPCLLAGVAAGMGLL
ncbi:hypothetical protein TOPH_08942 [Tolypocladium ophioglossoides CBS 100239]|uniref:Siderophore biosynthesis enzyme n=1 Tax=Tolypocladium ophioglossoides (strain CBS 100239) TaxID=1163406 RepID=A0A0L0MXF6_TOLOC|nr:hypothetical protein TOPH_08942 [Tolypocladium ophioglossoides CBS 100239]